MPTGNAGSLHVQLQADVAKFLAGLKKAQMAVGGMVGGLKNLASASTNAAKSSDMLSKSVVQVGSAYAALNMYRVAEGMAKAAANTQAATDVFLRAGGSLEELRKQTSGMISDANLVKKANLAETMGIARDDFAKLAQIAQAAAIKTGQSMDWMFDSIVTGTARQSRLILDNLGLIVSSEEANARATNGNKKLQMAMSETAKQQAFTTEVIRQGMEMVAEVGDVSATTAGRFAKLEADTANFTLQMGEALIPAFENLIWALKQSVPWLKHVGEEALAMGERFYRALDTLNQISWTADNLANLFEGIFTGKEFGLHDALLSETVTAMNAAKKEMNEFAEKYGTPETVGAEVFSKSGMRKAGFFSDETINEKYRRLKKNLEDLQDRYYRLRKQAASTHTTLEEGPKPPAPYTKPERPDAPRNLIGKGGKGPNYNKIADALIDRLNAEEEAFKASLIDIFEGYEADALSIDIEVAATARIEDAIVEQAAKKEAAERLLAGLPSISPEAATPPALNRSVSIAAPGMSAGSTTMSGTNALGKQATVKIDKPSITMIAEQASERTKAAFERTVEMINGTLDMFTGGGANFLGEAATGISMAAGATGPVGAVIGGVVEALAAFAPATEVVTEVLGEFLGHVGHAINPIIQATVPILRAFMPAIEAIANLLNGVLGTVLAGFAFGMASLVSMLIDWLIPGLDILAIGLAEAGEGVGKFFSLLGAGFSGVAFGLAWLQTAIYEFIQDLGIGWIADLVEPARAAAQENRDRAFEEMMENWQDASLRNWNWDGTSRAFDRLNEATRDASEAMGELNDELLNAPSAFKIERYRNDAANGDPFTPGSDSRAGGVNIYGDVNVHARDTEDFISMLRDSQRLQRLGRGETSGLAPYAGMG